MTTSIVPARLIAALAALGIVVSAAVTGRESQAAGPDQGSANSRGLEVRGRVVDGKTGEPVEGVTVRLRRREDGPPESSPSVVSDQRGMFTLRAPSPGDYSLSAFRPPASFGEFDRDPFSEVPTRWFRVPGSAATIVVRLWNYPQIAGTVRDEAGQPVQGIVVRALYKVVLGDRTVLKGVANTSRTNDQGRYVLGRLPPRSYLVVATPPMTSTALSFRTQYYAGASEAGGATAVHVAASQEVEGIDFHLRRERGYRVSGIVERKGLQDPVRLELYGMSSGELSVDFPVGAAGVSADGRFEILGVPPGSYELRFLRFPPWRSKGPTDVLPMFMTSPALPRQMASVPEDPTWWGAERVDVFDQDVSVSLVFKEGARVSGRIVTRGGETPSPQVLGSHGVYLRGIDHRFFAAAQLGAARGDGSFTTTALPFGRYVLGMLYPFPGFQLESVRVGGREVAGASFEVNGDINDAVVMLAPRTTAISGRINGEVKNDAFVLVWPEDQSLWTGAGTGLERIYRAVTSDGMYRLQVFPGAYRVVALAGLLPQDWESPEYLRSLIAESQRVTVPAGQTVTHNPPLVSRR